MQALKVTLKITINKKIFFSDSTVHVIMVQYEISSLYTDHGLRSKGLPVECLRAYTL